MTDFIQLLVSGIATGTIYALAALGFTLLWQASGTINFATGEFVMVSAFLMLAGLGLGLPLWASYLLSLVLATVILGYFFKRAIVDPLIRHGIMPVIVATIGLSLVAKNGIRIGFGAQAQPFPQIFGGELFQFAGVTVSYMEIGTIFLAWLIIFVLNLFLSKTVTGRAMQAVAQNTDSAVVLGINVNKMIFYTFAINAVLATTAALLVTPAYLAKFDMGVSLGMKAFLAAIIGGFNSSRGAMLGGLIVGICENLAGAYISAEYKEAVALVLFLLIILIKPNGLLGKAEQRKV
jgi:branched-chain amino acid transport system permease protein